MQSEQVHELSQRLLQVQDNERRHIARELHDSAGQILTALSMNVSMIAQQAEQTAPHLAKAAADAEEMIEKLSQEIRTTSYLLHPPLLDESGLVQALEWYTEGLRERSGLEIGLEVPEDFERLPSGMELALFRVVQECLTNVHRHSESHSAVIRLSTNNDKVSLEVEDRGKGLSPEKLAEIQSRHSGVGISGTRERVRQFQGDMRIESTGRGTKISVTFPHAALHVSE